MDSAAQNTISSTHRPGRALSFFRVAKILTAAFVLLAPVFLKIPSGARSYGYGVVRELVKLHTVIGTWNMAKMTSDHFYVKYEPEDRDQAKLVLDTAEHFYRPVTGDFGVRPHAKIPIILYSSKEELNKSFGWETNETAMGVYWAGTIRVLDPTAWIGDTDPARIKAAFVSSGPMAHELTHLMVDYLTGGNYPRWFTEGVAQYEEYKLTGFEFKDSAASLKQPLYSMKELTADFDDLSNQSLAYRESFLAVRYIVDNYGEGALYSLLKQLGRGRNFDQALHNVLQMDQARFETSWRDWALKISPI
jgi:hypothetical protein